MTQENEQQPTNEGGVLLAHSVCEDDLRSHFVFGPRTTLHGRMNAVRAYHNSHPKTPLKTICRAAGVNPSSYYYHFNQAKKTINDTSERRRRIVKLIEYYYPDKNAAINQRAVQRRLQLEGAPVGRATLHDILFLAGYSIKNDDKRKDEYMDEKPVRICGTIRALLITKMRREYDFLPRETLLRRMEAVRAYKDAHPECQLGLICDAAGIELNAYKYRMLRPPKSKNASAKRKLVLKEIRRHVHDTSTLVHPVALRRKILAAGVKVSASTLHSILKEAGYKLPGQSACSVTTSKIDN